MKRIMLVSAAAAAVLMACGEESGGSEKKLAPISSIALTADADFTVGTTVQLRVIATRNDATQDELDVAKEGITFASSDTSIATVDANGLVTVLVGGAVSFSAQMAETTFASTLETRTACDYPNFAADIVYDRTMPPLSWPAKTWDGQDFTLDLRDVHCDKEWKDIDTLIVVVSAAWCVPCKQYAKELAGQVEELEQHRTKILYVIGQDTEGIPCDTEYAYDYMDSIITAADGRMPGMVVGDASTSPMSAFVQTSSHLQFWPSSFIIRTRDMKIIASGNFLSGSRLDLTKIADDPEADYSRGNTGSFRNNCEDDEEEDTEPNNLPVQAVPVGAGTVTGGICADSPDLYQVGLEGRYQVRLSFDEDVGDLDVLVWDPNTNQPAVIDGEWVGSTGNTGDEIFEFTGPALVGVVGYKHASAPYSLTITEL